MRFDLSIKLFVLVFTSFFFPSKFIEFYTLGISLVIISLFPKISISKNVLIIFLVWCSYLSLMTATTTESIRNLTEIIRFLPIILIISLKDALSGQSSYYLTKLLMYFSIALACLCFIQVFFPLSLISRTTAEFYASSGHFEKSFLGNSRAIGVGNGPGQLGSLSTLLFAYCYAHLVYNNKKFRLLSFLGCISALFCVLAAQSQTSFIAISALIVMGYLSNLMRFNFIVHLSTSLATIAAIFNFIKLAEALDLRYLLLLFEHGLQRSSFQKRLEKWDYMFEMIYQDPFLWIFGAGKDFFGNASAATDSDFVFLILIYGLLPTMVLILFLGLLFLRWLVKSNLNTGVFWFIAFVGLIVSLTSAFLFDVKVAVIVCIVYLSNRGTIGGGNHDKTYTYVGASQQRTY